MQAKQIILKGVLVNYYSNSIKENVHNLIFIHGWGSDSIYWFKAFTEEFLSNYNVFCIDLPGFAKSEDPKEDLNVSKYGDFVKEFIEKMDLLNVVLIGHSLGGRISIKLGAGKSTRAKKIVLVNSAGIYHTTKSTKIVSKFASLLKPIFKLPLIKLLRRPIYKLLKAEDYLINPSLQTTFANIVSEDLTPYLNQIQIPTLIIWGKDDDNSHTPVEDAYKMNELIPNSKLVVLENAKHYSFVDQPKQFISELQNFLNA